MDRNKESKKEKTPAIETFPTDETPTPTKILRMADMDLFQDLKENPFDAHFRKAAEAVKQGADSLSASLSATEITSDDTLNTPQIYCSDGTTPLITHTSPSAPRPVILRANPHNRVTGSVVPIASVQPVKTYKPIAPNLASLPTIPSPDNAMLLLKFPGGETIKLSNLPFVKADQPPSPSTVNQETRLKLKRVLSTPRGAPVEIKSPTHSFPMVPTISNKNNEPVTEESEKNELKERNRMSAQRSRQKKRQHFESLAETCNNMQKENSALNTENKVLREEIVSLKRLLGHHLDCSVTQQTGQKEVLQNAIEPRIVKLVGQKSRLNTPKLQKMNILSAKSISKQAEENFMNIPVVLSTEENCSKNSFDNTEEIVEDNSSKYEKPSQNMIYMNKAVPSPPQIFPEDLRVDTRLKETEDSQYSKQGTTLTLTQDTDKIKIPLQNPGQATTGLSPNPGLSSPVFVRLTPTSENVKQTLAMHCHRVGNEREEKSTNKGVVAKRLKDKLQILKQKMAEDAGTFSAISSGPSNP